MMLGFEKCILIKIKSFENNIFLNDPFSDDSSHDKVM